MKFIHLGDLHLGKRLANYSLLEDQRYVLEQILDKGKSFKPDCWLICGDVFDRSVPSEETVALYDWFITQCVEMAPVFMIAGNHDSGRRLELFKSSLEKADIFIAGVYNGEVERIKLECGNENCNVYLLPYFNPTEVRLAKDLRVKSHAEAFKAILDDIEVNPDELNILLSHQFFTGSSGDFSEMEIGTLDGIGCEGLECFDYVALGHLHNQHHLSSERIRYCGTPIKYTLNDKRKFLNEVTLTKEKFDVELVELEPMRDVCLIEDTFENLMGREEVCEDYVAINLLDNRVVPNVKSSLIKRFPNLVQIKFNFENQTAEEEITFEEAIALSPVELLEQFFESNHHSLTEEERRLAEEIFEDLGKEEDYETA